MKLSTRLMLTVLAAIGMVAPIRAASPATLSKVVVALKPDKDPDSMIAERKQLSEYLSKALGKPVEVIVPLSSAVILEGLSNGTIDLAYLSATDMINATNEQTATLLLAGGAHMCIAGQSKCREANNRGPLLPVPSFKSRRCSSPMSQSPTSIRT